MPDMGKDHFYSINLKWTGNKGEGTAGYRTYERSHIISAGYKPDIPGSSDPAFQGDKTRYSPEDLLVASLSSCHMLWYLHLCADNGVVVVNYEDHAKGIMTEDSNGGGRFKEVVLNPVVTVSENSMIGKANELHKKANELCFIANSCNFPVHHQPICLVSEK
jgi:organic hydroperoxide reductase OsmC/OhrA